MASGARQTPTTTTLVHFLALPRHALSCCATAKTLVYKHTQRRVYDARRSRARYERGDRDRATARSTVTRAYIGPEALPAPLTTSRSSLCVYRDRVTAKPNPRFRIPSLALSGKALSSPLSSGCLPARPAGPRSLWTTCPPSGPIQDLATAKKIVSARTGGIKLGEIP